LASVRIQHRFIGNWTKDEYLLPEDILEDAADAVRLAFASTALSATNRDAVLKFANTLEKAQPDFSSADFYETDLQWIELCVAAADCLQSLGFDLEKYEADELNSNT
jgi:hypothetical protein